MTLRYIQDPDEVLDYGLEWDLQDDEEITASTWENPDALVTIDSSSFDAETGRTVVWISVPDETALESIATLTNHITTNQGRQRDRSIELLIVSC